MSILVVPFRIIGVIITVVILTALLSEFSTMDVADCQDVPDNASKSRQNFERSCNLTANFGGLAIFITVLVALFGGIFGLGRL